MTETGLNRPLLRPVIFCDSDARRGSVLAGGWLRFGDIAVEADSDAPQVLPAAAVAALYPEMAPVLARLHRPRAPLGSRWLDSPLPIMQVPEPFERDALVPLAQAAADAGAAALEVCVADDVDPESRASALSAAASSLPIVLSGPLPAHGFVPAGWRAPDWDALAAQALPPGCLRLSPRAASGLADAASVRACHEAAARRLDRLDTAGVDRATVVLDLGQAAPAALKALASLHGLGCSLMIRLEMPPFAAAAAAVVAASQGVQMIGSTTIEPVASGLALWRASLYTGPAAPPASVPAA